MDPENKASDASTPIAPQSPKKQSSPVSDNDSSAPPLPFAPYLMPSNPLSSSSSLASSSSSSRDVQTSNPSASVSLSSCMSSVLLLSMPSSASEYVDFDWDDEGYRVDAPGYRSKGKREAIQGIYIRIYTFALF